MKRISLVLVAGTALISAPACADDTHHPDEPQTAAPAATAPDARHLRQMQDSMIRMHELMHKIQQARDPKEREALMQQHRQSMREHMGAMRAMRGGGMPDGQMRPMMNDGGDKPPRTK